MCHYITATLPKETDLANARRYFAQYKLGFEAIENPSVFEHLEKGDVYILTTRGMCDCGTLLASGGRSKHAVNDSETTKYEQESIRKFKAKGWSDTKIQRWLQEVQLNRQKEKRRDELDHESALAGVDDWLSFIRDILSSRATTRIGILVHYYDGGVSSRIKVIRKERVHLQDLGAEFLVNMNEDVIYDFVG